MRELFLHVGFAKTGSSALQSWLASNVRELASLGFNYAGENESAKSYKTSSITISIKYSYLLWCF